MYYSSGNYEAFARPLKPDGVDRKSAYLAGAGLAGLAAACFLIRDGQMPGKHIHILEESKLPGGACDGYHYESWGLVIRGAHEMENHFECLWDLFRSIPSLETEDASVLDEYYWLNKKEPNYSLMSATEKRGTDAYMDGRFGLSDKACGELIKLFFMKDEDLYGRKIEDVLDEEFFRSNFWLYWRTMFAFREWHSALEMKRYLWRFIHHIGVVPDFSALKFKKYNQYESLILPMVKYLEQHGVQFLYDIKVTNVVFDIQEGKKTAKQLVCLREGMEETIDLIEDDLVFVMNGSCTENTAFGDDDHAPEFPQKPGQGGAWELWKNIAVQSPDFGHPEKFCMNPEKTNRESATVTITDERIPDYIEKICRRNPLSGRAAAEGIVTVKDSAWLLNWTVNRQMHFRNHPDHQLVVWLYGLFTDRPGDFICKPMRDCTGYEITQEWLYHIGVPEADIPKLARTGAHCVPCMMPYITSFFMPRVAGDRPKVVPEGSVNFAFLGQFADTVHDTVFTAEYSVRTAMEAVYTLLGVDRGVPEVFNSAYDIRCLLDAAVKLVDGRKLTDLRVPLITELLEKKLLKKMNGTVIEEMLERCQVI